MSQLDKIDGDIRNAKIEREDLYDMRKTFLYVQDRRKRDMGNYLRERMLSEARDDRAHVVEKHVVNRDKKDKKNGNKVSGKKKDKKNGNNDSGKQKTTKSGKNDSDKKTKKKKNLTTKEQPENDETMVTITGATRNRSINCNYQVPTKNKTEKAKSGTKKADKKTKKQLK